MTDVITKACQVCGQVGQGVAREVDQEAAWFSEVLKDINWENFDQTSTFCNICDELISEFEEISIKKRSLKQKIQLRVSSYKTSYEVIKNVNENSDDKMIRTGEIPNVINFVKSDVKIFEIGDPVDDTNVDGFLFEVAAPKKSKSYKNTKYNKFEEKFKYYFPCPICEKLFSKKSNLASHMLKHTDVTPFICDFLNCGKGFKREKTLTKHFQLIHEGIKDEFPCLHCDQKFLSYTGLQAHIGIHTGQEYFKRNNKCDVCDKSFRSPADLKTHSVVHTRAKPFNCTWSQCAQSFSQKASLKDHLNVHEKKFQCEGCEKCFGRERYLMLHFKTCAYLSRTKELVPKEEIIQVVKVEPTNEIICGEND